LFILKSTEYVGYNKAYFKTLSSVSIEQNNFVVAELNTAYLNYTGVLTKNTNSSTEF
jgi:hypothetical protein